MARIFISHSPTDVSFARQIGRALVELGANVWVDAADVPQNGRWHNDLNIGFELCDAMIVVLSGMSVAERRVLNDWNTYFQRKKPVILVATETPDRLGIHLEPGQYVDFAQQSYDTGIRQLIETLRYWGTLPAAQPVAPPAITMPQEATIRSQPTAQPARTETPVMRSEPAAEPARVTVEQETSAVPMAASATGSRYLLPVAIGLLLAILICGGIILFVVLPQTDLANQEATAVAATQVAQAYDQMTQVAVSTSSAATQIAQGTAIAVSQAQDALTATAIAPTLAYEATATAQAVAIQQAYESAATLSALQSTLSAEQAAARGVPPASAPTSNTYASQPLLFSLQREWFIDKYAVRYWSDPTFTYTTLVIESADQPRVQIDSFIGGSVSNVTGTDITGEGNPDVAFEVSHGGATGLSCTVLVYDLGPTITKVLETSPAACGSRFADLNGDGIPELILADTTYAYQFCNDAESPLVEAIMVYAPPYRPQSALYPDYYRGRVLSYLSETDLNAQLNSMAQASQMDSYKCRVLGLVLPYLYGGMSTEAWAAFNQYYRYSDAASFRSRIEQLFASSPFTR
ncbi:MAG: TIR domain-containing protein [Anaerolineae bacterium]|nr:TIR domain-containing protein [Anaerolineae bacterium]